MTPQRLDFTHDMAAVSWVESANGHPDFPVQNLPLGVFSARDSIDDKRRIGTAIGDYILDLSQVASLLDLGSTMVAALQTATLNAFLDLPISERQSLRHALFLALTDLKKRDQFRPHLLLANTCDMHLGLTIGDYTDFYVGINHATKVGSLFRPDQPLMPNYKHIPIGYHGRASSVRVSGAPVKRPSGQLKPPHLDAPYFGPSQRLDYELEMGVIISGQNALGETQSIGSAHERIGGLCLLNDWSARDMQGWEYQPLGPFLAKSFHSTISPWMITPEALAPFAAPAYARPEGDPSPLPYLLDSDDQAQGGYRITLEAHLQTKAMRDNGEEFARLSQTTSDTAMYWTIAQMITHHASNGCDLHAGDLLGTGTLSGPEPENAGSLLELSDGGKAPLTLPNGETRRFLEDGDTVRLSAYCLREGFARIGFGVCENTIAPARELPQ